jgi:modulator of FtsH protease
VQSSPAELFRDWHDFYLLTGTAAAALVGLVFVAASIGASVFTEQNRAALRAFISPTVVHFSSVFFICVLVTIPSHRWLTLGGLLIAAGLAGAIYSGGIWMQLFIRRSFKVDMTDRFFYALMPFLGYVLVMASGSMLFMPSEASLDLLAAALIVLLLAGIRNAWDMTFWIMTKSPAGAERKEPPA